MRFTCSSAKLQTFGLALLCMTLLNGIVFRQPLEDVLETEL